MELILLQDVKNVGQRGDVVSVRAGYARNFLVPRKLGVLADRSNRQFVEEHRARSQERKAKEKEQWQTKAKSLASLKLVIAAQSGSQGKLFGSVTSADIAHALAEQGWTLEKKQIHLKEPIRTVGTFAISLDLYPEVKSQISVQVVEKS